MYIAVVICGGREQVEMKSYQLQPFVFNPEVMTVVFLFAKHLLRTLVRVGTQKLTMINTGCEIPHLKVFISPQYGANYFKAHYLLSQFVLRKYFSFTVFY